jgi:hypothetical protein
MSDAIIIRITRLNAFRMTFRERLRAAAQIMRGGKYVEFVRVPIVNMDRADEVARTEVLRLVDWNYVDAGTLNWVGQTDAKRAR